MFSLFLVKKYLLLLLVFLYSFLLFRNSFSTTPLARLASNADSEAGHLFGLAQASASSLVGSSQGLSESTESPQGPKRKNGPGVALFLRCFFGGKNGVCLCFFLGKRFLRCFFWGKQKVFCFFVFFFWCFLGVFWFFVLGVCLFFWGKAKLG